MYLKNYPEKSDLEIFVEDWHLSVPSEVSGTVGSTKYIDIV